MDFSGFSDFSELTEDVSAEKSVLQVKSNEAVTNKEEKENFTKVSTFKNR